MIQLKEGTTVKTVDGETVGRIDHIVVDPTIDRVTHIVVKKGFLFTQDRVIPVEALREADDDSVRLEIDEEAFDAFPPYEETHYVRPDRDYLPHEASDDHWDAPRPLFFYASPHSGMYPPPAGVISAERVERTVRNVPEATIAIEQGTKVLSIDGEHVGDVEQTFADKDGNLTHLMISKGFLFTTERLVPIQWVHQTGEDEIHLNVRTGLVEDLPEYDG